MIPTAASLPTWLIAVGAFFAGVGSALSGVAAWQKRKGGGA